MRDRPTRTPPGMEHSPNLADWEDILQDPDLRPRPRREVPLTAFA